MKLHAWTQTEWTQAVEALDAQGVDTRKMLEAWESHLSMTPEVCSYPEPPSVYGWGEDDVILDDARHNWLCGVLASELDATTMPD
jgi:hypothetical protein